MKRKNPQIEVDAFNAIMGVGDPIDYWEILGRVTRSGTPPERLPKY